MMARYESAPRNVRALTDRLTNISRSRVAGELLRRALACVIVGQLLSDGLVKGGAAMRIRLGATATRFSRDLDVSRRGDLDAFIDGLQVRLRDGWAGFTGRVVTLDPPRPAGAPGSRVVQPASRRHRRVERPHSVDAPGDPASSRIPVRRRPQGTAQVASEAERCLAPRQR